MRHHAPCQALTHQLWATLAAGLFADGETAAVGCRPRLLGDGGGDSTAAISISDPALARLAACS